MVPAGSRLSHLQEIAEEVHSLCSVNGIILKVEWVPRESIQLADTLSKIPDYDDWEVTEEFFNELDFLWEE